MVKYAVDLSDLELLIVVSALGCDKSKFVPIGKEDNHEQTIPYKPRREIVTMQGLPKKNSNVS